MDIFWIGSNNKERKVEERRKNMKESAVQQTLIARTKYVKKAQGEQF